MDTLSTKRPGNPSGRPKLTKGEISLIRSAYTARGVTQLELAKRFGVGKTNIHLIVNNKSWRHV